MLYCSLVVNITFTNLRFHGRESLRSENILRSYRMQESIVYTATRLHEIVLFTFNKTKKQLFCGNVNFHKSSPHIFQSLHIHVFASIFISYYSLHITIWSVSILEFNLTEEILFGQSSTVGRSHCFGRDAFRNECDERQKRCLF